MGKPSREEDILKLFFEEPTKHWHFQEIKQNVPIADNKVSRWLKKFLRKKIIKKIHPSKKMPYYLSNYEHPEYQNQKRIYALKNLHQSGFLNHLTTLKKAKTVILFGSFSRWDWHKDSDIDLFIFGDDYNTSSETEKRTVRISTICFELHSINSCYDCLRLFR